MPPESVTIAAALRISGTQSGAVMCVTSTSPSFSRVASASSAITRTGPLASPGAAPRPLISSAPELHLAVGAAVAAGDVTGRD